MNDEDIEKKLIVLRDKYLTFLKNLIQSLQSVPNRAQQLDKFETLHGLLTNNDKKLKPETIGKIEIALINLHAKFGKKEEAPKIKVEKNNDQEYLDKKKDEPKTKTTTEKSVVDKKFERLTGSVTTLPSTSSGIASSKHHRDYLPSSYSRDRGRDYGRDRKSHHSSHSSRDRDHNSSKSSYVSNSEELYKRRPYIKSENDSSRNRSHSNERSRYVENVSSSEEDWDLEILQAEEAKKRVQPKEEKKDDWDSDFKMLKTSVFKRLGDKRDCNNYKNFEISIPNKDSKSKSSTKQKSPLNSDDIFDLLSDSDKEDLNNKDINELHNLKQRLMNVINTEGGENSNESVDDSLGPKDQLRKDLEKAVKIEKDTKENVRLALKYPRKKSETRPEILSPPLPKVEILPSQPPPPPPPPPTSPHRTKVVPTLASVDSIPFPPSHRSVLDLPMPDFKDIKIPPPPPPNRPTEVPQNIATHITTVPMMPVAIAMPSTPFQQHQQKIATVVTTGLQPIFPVFTQHQPVTNIQPPVTVPSYVSKDPRLAKTVITNTDPRLRRRQESIEGPGSPTAGITSATEHFNQMNLIPLINPSVSYNIFDQISHSSIPMAQKPIAAIIPNTIAHSVKKPLLLTPLIPSTAVKCQQVLSSPIQSPSASNSPLCNELDEDSNSHFNRFHPKLNDLTTERKLYEKSRKQNHNDDEAAKLKEQERAIEAKRRNEVKIVREREKNDRDRDRYKPAMTSRDRFDSYNPKFPKFATNKNFRAEVRKENKHPESTSTTQTTETVTSSTTTTTSDSGLNKKSKFDSLYSSMKGSNNKKIPKKENKPDRPVEAPKFKIPKLKKTDDEKRTPDDDWINEELEREKQEKTKVERDRKEKERIEREKEKDLKEREEKEQLSKEREEDKKRMAQKTREVATRPREINRQPDPPHPLYLAKCNKVEKNRDSCEDIPVSDVKKSTKNNRKKEITPNIITTVAAGSCSPPIMEVKQPANETSSIDKESSAPKVSEDVSPDTLSNEKTEESVSVSVPENKSSEEKQEPSSTSNQKEEITKEWIESFFVKLLNSNNLLNAIPKDNLLSILSKSIDEKKFNKIKEIVERDDEDDDDDDDDTNAKPTESETTGAVDVSEKNIEQEISKNNIEDSCEKDSPTNVEAKTKKCKGRSKKNELDRLNEDIRDMFISEGVLTITGRRLCTMINYNETHGSTTTQIPDVDTSITSTDTEETKRKVISKSVVKPKAKTNEKKNAPGRRVTRSLNTTATSTTSSDESAADDSNNDATETSSSESDTDVIESPKKKITKSNTQTAKPSKVELAKTAVVTARKKIPTKKTTDDKLREDDENSQSTTASVSSDKKKKRRRRGIWASGYTRKKKPSPSKAKPVKAKPVKVVNNNALMYMGSNHSKQCSFCGFQDNRHMASHYANKHPQHEVLTSRFKPSIAKLFRTKSERQATVTKSNPNMKLKFKCYFCDKDMVFDKNAWLRHMTTHTGEYISKCSKCDFRTSHSVKHSAICNGSINTVNFFKWTDNKLFAHMCTKCNYVQLDEDRAKCHTSSQHMTAENAEVLKVVLISYQKDTLGRKSSCDTVKESTTITESVVETSQNTPEIEANDVVEKQPKIEKDVQLVLKSAPIAEKLEQKLKSPPREIANLNETIKNSPKTEVDLKVGDGRCDNQLIVPSEIITANPPIEPDEDEDDDEDDDDDDEDWEDMDDDDGDDESVNKCVIDDDNKVQDKLRNTVQRLQETINTPKRKFETTVTESSPKKKRVDFRDILRNREKPGDDEQKEPTILDKSKEEPISPLLKEIKPDPDRPDPIVSETLYRIDHMGCRRVGPDYAIEYQFECLFDGCDFKSKDGCEFIDHLNEKSSQVWEGYCYTCVAQVKTERSVIDLEFKHMLDVHSKKTLPIDVDSPSRPVRLSIRRLSGDQLSSMTTVSTPPVQTPTPSKIVQVQNKPPVAKVIDPSLVKSLRSLDLSKLKVYQFVPKSLVSNLPEIQKGTQNSILLKSPINPATNTILTPVVSGIKITNPATLTTGTTVAPIQQSIITPAPGSFLQISNVQSCAVSSAAQIEQESTKANTSSSFVKISSVEDGVGNIQVMRHDSLQRNTSKSVTAIISATNKQITAMEPPITTSTNSDYVNILKPWLKIENLKTFSVCQEMLRETDLYKLFKCMAITCSFCTSDREEFLEHIRGHEQQLEDQLQQNAVNLDTTSWLECSYCEKFADSCSDLLKHVETEHSYCTYQCSYCFYRSYLATNVVVHRTIYHKNKPLNIHMPDGYNKHTEINFNEVLQQRDINVRPIKCGVTGCSDNFYAIDKLLQHLHNHNESNFTCEHCSVTVPKMTSIKHLLCHRIGLFECVFCSFGTNKVDLYYQHLSNFHQTKPLYMCVRLLRRNMKPSDSQTNLNSCLLVNIALSLNMKIVKSTAENVQSKLLENARPNTVSHCFMECLVSLSECNATIDDYNKYRSEMSLENLVPSSSSITNDQLVTKEVIVTRSEEINPTVLEKVAMKLSLEPLSRKNMPCLYDNCKKMQRDMVAVNQDLLLHDGRASKRIECYFCSRTDFKAISLLAKHLKTHRFRFFCALCAYKSPTCRLTEAHLKSVHNIRETTFLNLNPAVTEDDLQNYIVGPKTLKGVDVAKFAKKMIDNYHIDLNRMKKAFEPHEADLLPREEIFLREIFCSVCNYSTKVRMNMYRHLMFHRELVPVTSLDPVNPVPCLNTAEKHFDRMSNLACSSQEDREKLRIFNDAPKFIPDVQRFVCGASYCHYISIGEDMLKFHIDTLHADDSIYRCPHCQNTSECMDGGKLCSKKILAHYRLHDSKLYKCGLCDYMDNQKVTIEKHIKDLHHGTTSPIIIRDETVSHPPMQINSSTVDGGNGNSTAGINVGASTSTGNITSSRNSAVSATNESTDGGVGWICNLCHHTTMTRKQIIRHSFDQHQHKSQFQCELCGYRSNLRGTMEEHFRSRHSGVEEKIQLNFSKINDDQDITILDNSPLWSRDANKVKSIRGILFEDEELHFDKNADENDDDSSNSEVDVICIMDDDEETEIDEDIETLYLCSYCSYTALIVDLRKHHKEKHNHLQFLPKKTQVSRMAEKPSSELVSNKSYTPRKVGIQYVCAWCLKRSENLQNLYVHWREKHQSTRVTQSTQFRLRPFWFRISKLVCCFYCPKRMPYMEVASHIMKRHYGKPFASVDIGNSERCGDCPYVHLSFNRNDLIEHYKRKHYTSSEKPKLSPADHIEEPFIEYFISLKAKNQYVCMICQMESDSCEELEQHHLAVHSNEPNSYIQRKQQQIAYGCPTCKEFVYDEFDMIRHIRRHIIASREISAASKEKDGPIDFVKELHRFETMRVTFPNGFTTTKGDLVNTKYGSFEEFIPKIRELQKTEPNAIRRRASTYCDRPPIELLDDDDFIRPTKRMKFGSEIPSGSGHKKSATLSQDEYFSFYDPDKRPNINIKNLFTTIEHDEKIMKIPIERFASLYSINPTLKLNKLDFSKYLEKN